MKGRELITLLGGAAAAWPLGVFGQQPAQHNATVVSYDVARFRHEASYASGGDVTKDLLGLRAYEDDAMAVGLPSSHFIL
jgi:hypothetical protein